MVLFDGLKEHSHLLFFISLLGLGLIEFKSMFIFKPNVQEDKYFK